MEKKGKGFLYEITIEIIAIFIGITLALFIDNFKDERQSIAEVKKHFNLILTEFSKDSVELQEIDSLLNLQIEKTNLLLIHLNNNDSKSFNQYLDHFGEARIYNPRIDEINLVLNSSSYSQIYNDSIFSRLNDLKSDCKTLIFIQENECQIITKLRDNFIFPYWSPKSQSIDLTQIGNKNHFFNQLNEYKNILEAKKDFIGSILFGSQQSVENIKEIMN